MKHNLSTVANDADLPKLSHATKSSEIMVLPAWFKNAKPKRAVTLDFTNQLDLFSEAPTFASRLTRSGVDLVTVKELLGHSTISTTMRYAHTNHETKALAVAKLPTGSKIVTIVPRKRKTLKSA